MAVTVTTTPNVISKYSKKYDQKDRPLYIHTVLNILKSTVPFPSLPISLTSTHTSFHGALCLLREEIRREQYVAEPVLYFLNRSVQYRHLGLFCLERSPRKI